MRVLASPGPMRAGLKIKPQEAGRMAAMRQYGYLGLGGFYDKKTLYFSARRTNTSRGLDPDSYYHY